MTRAAAVAIRSKARLRYLDVGDPPPLSAGYRTSIQLTLLVSPWQLGVTLVATTPKLCNKLTAFAL